MKRLLLLTALLLFALPALAVSTEDAQLDIACLRKAYPGFILNEKYGSGGAILLETSTGETIVYDDGKKKTLAEELEDGDIEDSMRRPYPLEPNRPNLSDEQEPGRIRSMPLLKALYGHDKPAVLRNVTRMPLANESIQTHRRLQKALNALQAELKPLLAARPDLAKYCKSMGCQYWRVIAGTNRLSPHSFGIAIDMNPKIATYWRWAGKKRHALQDSYPGEIVALFEKHGFIWGGKWPHYDIMHFEYRPELICKARRLRAAQQKPVLQKPLQRKPAPRKADFPAPHED